MKLTDEINRAVASLGQTYSDGSLERHAERLTAIEDLLNILARELFDICRKCGGNGYVLGRVCEQCEGSGLKQPEEV